MLALAGRLEVLKDRIARYWRLEESSPSWKVPAPALIEPPRPLFSLDSSTQPSCAPVDLKLTTCGTRTGVRVGVGVTRPPVVNDHQVPPFVSSTFFGTHTPHKIAWTCQ